MRGRRERVEQCYETCTVPRAHVVAMRAVGLATLPGRRDLAQAGSHSSAWNSALQHTLFNAITSWGFEPDQLRMRGLRERVGQRCETCTVPRDHAVKM